MSASGDERKDIDVKAAIAAIQQQKRETAKQESEAAAAKQTLIRAGRYQPNVYDSLAALQKIQKDSVSVKVSEAENRKNDNQTIRPHPAAIPATVASAQRARCRNAKARSIQSAWQLQNKLRSTERVEPCHWRLSTMPTATTKEWRPARSGSPGLKRLMFFVCS